MQTSEALDELFKRIDSAKLELSEITATNVDLQSQCQTQQEEVVALQKDKINTQKELKEMVSKVELLMQQKVKLETRLNSLQHD